ncbi:AbrB/MazE/SpoVT family DNA-binding domain-containing protein [Thermococcus alcaliphilus]|uniref:AbrB/MazE/SpoVT family DNA-binding domain-containing protein n=1 Tax=Thermococcus alcaliphilus TaxID=139207 RepID=UPI002090B66E|nr:AbrB/MazE/SpoVT family DNA-binding domain-containing protein [Thermococcus alcaliphilus]
MGKVGITKVDEKGRILLPKEIRKKLRIKKGEEFLITELDNETIILKRFDVKSMLQELVKKAEKVNLKKLEKEIEGEGNRIARKKYKISD